MIWLGLASDPALYQNIIINHLNTDTMLHISRRSAHMHMTVKHSCAQIAVSEVQITVSRQSECYLLFT